ncbi:MBL fold metallo-hydrolase [Haloactinomyces albus]|uniref:L-ascorbate metabolism protein UlaG (Beta-lactamase superfamily) n=1 Tax=Haloactinomyces albus TaxID=1352928 RepID=A0AAE3ZEG3_9ACTN|nr:MBL fold metallo-hydrolase [Haloactinomyces albus]MDR7303426.1 L-ascorbate metabolism protein UlaG (beta-lactamase superfamily) [Haloactinomyces albus]
MKRRSFAERLSLAPPGLSDMLHLMWAGGFGMTRQDGDGVPILRTGLPAIDASETSVTWIGHATYVLRIAGTCLLIDPVWSGRIPGVRQRLTPPGLAFAELPSIDAVLISHNHYDHLDAPTMRRLPRSTPVFAPIGLGKWFARRGFGSVTEFDWWESAQLGGIRIDFVPARHWSRRTLWDTCCSLWGGWVVTGPDGRRLYHAGDSGYGEHFAEIGHHYPEIEVAMLPIGAYEPRWFMKAVHMDPEEAVQAASDLGASRMTGMHWGTFALTSEPPTEPLTRLRKAWHDAGHDPDELWDLAVGETRLLGAGC